MDAEFVTCPECGKPFPSASVLEWHQENVHRSKNAAVGAGSGAPASGGQNPRSCPECGVSFDSESLLRWHREGIHGVDGLSRPSPPPDAEFSRSTTRKIGCAMYSVLFLVFVIGGLAFHWPGEIVAIGLIGTPIVFVITYFMDEREADWKEQTRAEFRQNYQTPPQYAQEPAFQVIRALTPEQEARLPECVERWRGIGLSTEPADRPKAEQAIAAIYETAGIRRRPRIVWCASPLASGLTRAIVQRTSRFGRLAPRTAEEILAQARERVTDGVRQDFWESVMQSVAASTVGAIGASVAGRIRGYRSPIYDGELVDSIEGVVDDMWDLAGYPKEENSWDMVEHAIRGAAGNDIWRTVQDRVENQVAGSIDRVIFSIGVSIGMNVGVSKAESKQDRKRADRDDYRFTGEINVTDVSSPDQTRYQREKVKARVKNSLGESEEDSIGNSVRASVRNSCFGQHDAGRLALFDFFRSVCGLEKQTDPVRGQWEQAQAAGWYLPHSNICWASERHNILHLDVRTGLHCDTGPALQYPDGWSVYALNGVVMNRRYVLTPADRLDPGVILQESNVDIRRELLRKVGVGRMLKYGKEVDRQGNYRLIDMSALFKGSNIRYAPYLLMQSASVNGAQHIEGVGPECRTVEQAVNWRASEVAKTWTPDLLS